MKLKPKSTTLNPRALCYKRFTDIQKSFTKDLLYFTISDNKCWVFNKDTNILGGGSFIEVEKDSYPTTDGKFITIDDTTYVKVSEKSYFYYIKDFGWSFSGNEGIITLNATFANIGKYQTNEYYFAGSFDYIVRGSIEGSTTQYTKGLITPLSSFNIKHFDDTINLCPDDLVVIDGHLYSVEDVDVDHKHQPKDYCVYFATLNNIL